MSLSHRWSAPMSAADARTVLALLGISQTELAALLDVDARTVRRWLATDALDATPMPSPAAILLRVFVACPKLFDAVRTDAPLTE